MRGSWNRQPPSGYELVRTRFGKGKPVSVEPFLTGFAGRSVGIALAKDAAAGRRRPHWRPERDFKF